LTPATASARELPDHPGGGIEQIAAAWRRVMIPHVRVVAGPTARMVMIGSFLSCNVH
jgi:hypothetical protein